MPTSSEVTVLSEARRLEERMLMQRRLDRRFALMTQVATLQAISAFIVAVIIHVSVPAWAKDFDEGKFEFNWACATCHGTDVKGKGPLSSALNTPPADLTVLAKNNNGAFPLTHVYEVVDGRKVIEAHGTRQMSIWGAFSSNELYPSDKLVDPSYDPEAGVRKRILAIIDYLIRIQEK